MQLLNVEHEPGRSLAIRARSVHDAANLWLEEQIKEGECRVGHRYYLRVEMLEPGPSEEGHHKHTQFLSVCAEPVYRIKSFMGFHG